jgi:hypothetical protein
MHAPWPWLAVLLLTAGCLTETKLQPLPSARGVTEDAALAEAQGIRLVAEGDAWRGTPKALERYLTPVRVQLENRGERPVRIAPEHFELVGGSRFRYAALSLFELHKADDATATGGSGAAGTGQEEGEARTRAEDSARAHAHNSTLTLGWGGPGRPGPWGPWGWSGYYDPFWDPFYGPNTRWREPEPLPTQDMVRQALPEGTLEPGASISGFVYFHDVSAREGNVTLEARLVDARTGEQFGTLAIPFSVER